MHTQTLVCGKASEHALSIGDQVPHSRLSFLGVILCVSAIVGMRNVFILLLLPRLWQRRRRLLWQSVADVAMVVPRLHLMRLHLLSRKLVLRLRLVIDLLLKLLRHLRLPGCRS